MTQAQILEGTTEEVARQIQQSYAGRKLRVFVEPEENEPEEEEDLAAGLPAPPDTLRDRAHLIELLHEGMQGAPEPLRQEEWTEIREEIRRRLAFKKQ